MSKITRIIFIAILIVLVVFIFIRISRKSAAKKPDAKGKAVAKALPVDAFIAKAGYFQNEISLTGTLLANEEVELRSEIAGKIQQINFMEGTFVRNGQLLVKINDDDLKAQLKKVNLQIELATKEESRKKKLLDINGISQEDYDLALNNLNSLKADAELIQSQLDKTQITAPFDGMIGLRKVSRGSYINSSTVIATLQMTDPIKIEFSVPDKYMSLVKKDAGIVFTNEGNGKEYHAKVYAYEPSIDLTTGTGKVRAICPNTDGLLPGSFVNVKLVLEKSENTIQVPAQAVVPQLKGQVVFIMQNGIAKQVGIETGSRTDTSVQVLNGIHQGDTVITSGLLQIKTGTRLKVRKVSNN